MPDSTCSQLPAGAGFRPATASDCWARAGREPTLSHPRDGHMETMGEDVEESFRLFKDTWFSHKRGMEGERNVGWSLRSLQVCVRGFTSQKVEGYGHMMASWAELMEPLEGIAHVDFGGQEAVTWWEKAVVFADLLGTVDRWSPRSQSWRTDVCTLGPTMWLKVAMLKDCYETPAKLWKSILCVPALR